MYLSARVPWVMTVSESKLGERPPECNCTPSRRNNTAPVCGEDHPGKPYECAKPPGHDGDHVACVIWEHAIEVWGDSDE